MDFASLIPFSTEVGYLGLALVNFFGSLIPFIPLPGFILLASMSVGEQYNLHALALISALTATVAKQIIFYLSYHGRRIINEKTRTRMRPFERLVKRYGAAAAFVAAATPIPDDLIYIPLGLAKYNPKRFFLATLSGKIVLSYCIILISHSVGVSLLDPFLEDVTDVNTVYIGIIIFSAIMTLSIVLVLKLDWRRILGRFVPWTLDENNK
ncbi:MAG: VTT domain-containing protein [Nitrosarchaeum sp.]|nr:VTT domain-containing protein [Nitrosarchaeum sp.]MBP0120133.1 VTT domain-containing protein [Nitrosarchaeum sp.]MBP0134098.1 VTT domain-containing protein [Nitrosarchaeum sp.]